MHTRLLAATLLILATNATAAQPAAWSSRTCAGCHGSANLQSWPSNFLSGLTSSNFGARLIAQAGNSATMPTLANDASPTGVADRASILQYLLDARDGRITGSLDLGTVTIDAPSGTTGTVTITNERSRAVSYTAPSISPSNNGFSVTAESCGVRSVPAGGSCTLTVRFLPTSPPADTDTTPRSASLSLTLSGTGGDPDPGAKSVSLSGTAQTSLEITTGPLSFTAALLSTSPQQNVTVNNPLGSNLQLCLVDSGGSMFAAPGDFNLVGQTLASTPRCTTLTSPGTTIVQPVTFTPMAAGPRLARLTVQRVGSGNSLLLPLRWVELEGNAGPLLNTSANTLFSGVRQDVNAGPTAPTVITLSNAGNATLLFSSISIPRVAGAGSDEYTTSGCAVGTTLAQGASCNLSVFFDPVDIGTRTTTLLIGYSDPIDTPASRRTASIDLRGQGTRGATLRVQNAGGTTLATGSAVAFGQQNIAVIYPRRLRLSNIGSDEDLAVLAPTFVPGAGGFDLVAPSGGGCSTPTIGFTLAAGTSCEVDVRFLPTAVTNYATNLTLASRPAGQVTAPINFVLNLSGQGVNGRPVLAWQTAVGDPLSLLDVPGITAVGSAMPPQVSLRLANAGPGAAALQLLNVIGPDASSFTIEAAAPGSCEFGSAAAPLLEGATCAVVITFRPLTAGAKTGRLQLVSTGTTPAPLEISAQASGPAVTIALMAQPTPLNLNEVRVGGQSAPATVTLFNQGSISAVVTAIDVSSGFAFAQGSCGALPFSIASGGSCTLLVNFAPASVGVASGSLRVQVSGVLTPVEVALQGTGVPAADVSSGGCSISNGQSVLDPTLWALMLVAAAVLLYRGRRPGRALHDAHPHR